MSGSRGPAGRLVRQRPRRAHHAAAGQGGRQLGAKCHAGTASRGFGATWVPVAGTLLHQCLPAAIPRRSLQVIFALPATDGTDYAMRIFNSDGSEPEMCGNGIRCLARFVAGGCRLAAPRPVCP